MKCYASRNTLQQKNADVCEAVLKHGYIDRSKKSDVYINIQVNVKVQTTQSNPPRRAEQFGPVRATPRTLNQLYADPNNGSAMYIYVPNVESLNAMPISAQKAYI